jgi:hypothetical protein
LQCVTRYSTKYTHKGKKELGEKLPLTEGFSTPRKKIRIECEETTEIFPLNFFLKKVEEEVKSRFSPEDLADQLCVIL